jgi:inositol hexakisphosphate/diphosphoinositol-pentakisphosphate kinase
MACDDAEPEELSSGRSIRLGVCVMQKKQVKLARLLAELRQGGDLEIVLFPQDQILEAPVAQWPVVDVLIVFYSRGFPLDKVRIHAAHTHLSRVRSRAH